MEILELAHRLRFECVTEEQAAEALSEIHDPHKTATVARSLVSAFQSDLLDARGLDEFMRIQNGIQDLKHLLWLLGGE
jgi:hypothetical protein